MPQRQDELSGLSLGCVKLGPLCLAVLPVILDVPLHSEVVLIVWQVCHVDTEYFTLNAEKHKIHIPFDVLIKCLNHIMKCTWILLTAKYILSTWRLEMVHYGHQQKTVGQCGEMFLVVPLKQLCCHPLTHLLILPPLHRTRPPKPLPLMLVSLSSIRPTMKIIFVKFDTLIFFH